jgi:hypothetical protein
LLGVGQFRVDAATGDFGTLTGPTIEQLYGAISVMGGRQEFGAFALKSMPANALYAGFAGKETTDPKFVD